MFKVSFKDDFKNVLVFQDKVTVVTLTGKIVIDIEHIPHDIWTWAMEHPSIDISVTYNNERENWILKASGKAKCHTEDTPNPKIGERIAESRAKLRLYKFMMTLTSKLCTYYYAMVYGKQGKATSNFVVPNDQTSLFVTNKKYTGLYVKETQHLDKLLKGL